MDGGASQQLAHTVGTLKTAAHPERSLAGATSSVGLASLAAAPSKSMTGSFSRCWNTQFLPHRPVSVAKESFLQRFPDHFRALG